MTDDLAIMQAACDRVNQLPQEDYGSPEWRLQFAEQGVSTIQVPYEDRWALQVMREAE